MLNLSKLHAVDFETDGIDSRPLYPPVPVGVVIYGPTIKKYFAWRHPSENNCTVKQVTAQLKELYRQYPIVFHHAEFDLDVGCTHLKLPYPAEWHDTLYMAFMNNPHDASLSLKPLADKYLDMPPDEQTALKNWILKNVPNTHEKKDPKKDPLLFWAANICKAPGDLVGKYAIGDGVRTLKLTKYFMPILEKEKLLEPYNRERALAPTTIQMQKPGIRINLRKLKTDMHAWETRVITLDKTIQKRLGYTFDIGSGKQLAAAMEHAGVINEWVLTKKKNKSTARKNLEKCCNDKKLVDMLALRGVYEKYITGFARPWVRSAEQFDGRIYPGFHQIRTSFDYHDGGAGTRSGRYSSSNPNLQNVPRNPHDDNKKWTLELPELRSYIQPDEGCSFLRRDYSAQELRILAHFAEGDLLAKFLQDPWLKIHKYVQEEVRRRTGTLFPYEYIKSTLFGLMYGMGNQLLADRLDTTLETAKKLKQVCFMVLPGIEDLMDELKTMAANGEPLRTWGGRLYYCEAPRMIDGKWRTMDYKMLNYLIQPSAADCTKQAMVNLSQLWSGLTDVRIALQVHDELMACCKIGKEKQHMRDMTEAMEAVKFDLPMLTEGKASRLNWAAMKPFEALSANRADATIKGLTG